MVTKVTNTVIEANTVIAAVIANNAVGERHIQDGSITSPKLGPGVNVESVSSNVDTVQANLTSLQNDTATFGGIKYFDDVEVANNFVVGNASFAAATMEVDYDSNTVAVDAHTFTMGANLHFTGIKHINIFSNPEGFPSGVANLLFNDNRYYTNDAVTLTNAHANDHVTYQAITGGPLLTVAGDVIIQGNATIEGDTFTANVGTIVSEDKQIIVNNTGSDATAEGAGIGIEGTGTALLANIEYADASISKFRIGTGTLAAADDIARAGDLGTQGAAANDYATFLNAHANDHVNYLAERANDFNTFGQAKANDFVTFTQLNANINAVSGNVDAKIGLVGDFWYNTNSTSGTSNVFFLGGPGTNVAANSISASLDGVHQGDDCFVLHSANNTIQFTDATVPSGLTLDTTVVEFN